MNFPIFTVSLDFELHWGRFDKYRLEEYLSYYQGTRKVIPQILHLFEKSGIHATWATVGMLFAEDLSEWKYYQPLKLPEYEKEKYSAYSWLNQNPNADLSCLFAPDLIKRILMTPYQEIGSHTFAHYYTCEKGQTVGQFREDLKAAKKIAAEKFNIELKSLVFPRNQFNQQAIEVVESEGFSVIRSNPEDWYWRNAHEETLLKKIFRTGDTLTRLGKKSSYTFPAKKGNLLQLPASRLFRPYMGNGMLIRTGIERIKTEMTVAAQNTEVYHLWWHPHNFGLYPKENLTFLAEILNYFTELKDEYGMVSMNMEETSRLVN